TQAVYFFEIKIQIKTDKHLKPFNRVPEASFNTGLNQSRASFNPYMLSFKSTTNFLKPHNIFYLQLSSGSFIQHRIKSKLRLIPIC
ncbi:MAG: hypothetical protein LC111_10230, partial [Bacteroidia bacterium]|nr:hypothetical protein [Bacteroidia bacterium]